MENKCHPEYDACYSINTRFVVGRLHVNNPDLSGHHNEECFNLFFYLPY
jgi:hypothetical protein